MSSLAILLNHLSSHDLDSDDLVIAAEAEHTATVGDVVHLRYRA